MSSLRPTLVALLALTASGAAMPPSRATADDAAAATAAAANAAVATAKAAETDANPPLASPTTRPTALDADAMRTALADLNHPDPATRRQAYERLMGMSRDDLNAFRTVVDQARPLLPSQAAVLREIVAQAYLSGEVYRAAPHTGFLGVKLQAVAVSAQSEERLGANEPAELREAGAAPGRFGILITERVPGFCGARSLMDGDVVLSIVGHPLRMSGDRLDRQLTEEFSLTVRECGPGTVVTFELLRQGRVMRVPVRLDPRPELADPNGIAVPGEITLDDFNLARRRKADRYWDETFRPLLGEQVG